MIRLRNNAQYIIVHYCAFLFEIHHKRYARLPKLSQSALVVLDCFRSSPEKRLKVSDIEEDTGMPRRTVQSALHTLTQKGFIQKSGQKAGTPYQL